VKFTIDPLAPGTLPLSAFARTALAGERRADALSVARSLHDVPQPADRFDPDARANLVDALERRLARSEPPVAVLDALRSLRAPGTFAVLTGQQPGLLASPLLSLYKAVSAVRLARNLSQAWETPVVAVFWNHADDHDIAEVNHAHFVNANLDLQRVRLAGTSSGRQPISRIVLDEEHNQLAGLRALLEQLLAGEPHAAEALDLCAPVAGESLADAFTRCMTRLLGPAGLIVLEPDWIRADLSHALAGIVGADPLPLLEQGSAELRALDLEPAIDPREAALLFRVDAAGRRALRPGGDGFRFDGEPGSRTVAELASEIVSEPQAFSAGALLRPVVQDLCLPTAAYVGGWAELAYQSQLLPLRRAVGAPPTPLVPRASCTIVEPEVARSLRKLEVSAEQVLRTSGQFEVDEDPPPPVLEDLSRVAHEAAAGLRELEPRMRELDPGLAQNVGRAARQVRDLIEKLRGKAERVHANRSGKGRRHVRRVQNALAPNGQPQERVLGPLPLLARYGTTWIDELTDRIAPIETRHVLVSIHEQEDRNEGQRE